MKQFVKILSLVVLINNSFAYAVGDTTPAPIQTHEESPRSTFVGSFTTNIKESLPLVIYGILGACSGANLKGEGTKIVVPGTNAEFHIIWTAGLFILTTGKTLLEVDSSKYGKIIKDGLINSAFAMGIGAAAFTYGAPVGLSITAAFVASRILTAGDNSPLEYVKGTAS